MCKNSRDHERLGKPKFFFGNTQFVWLALVLAASVAVSGARAADVNFTLIAEGSGSDTSLPFSLIDGAPSVSSEGVVGFEARPHEAEIDWGIYLGAGTEQNFGDYTSVAQDSPGSSTDLNSFTVGEFSGEQLAFSAFDGSTGSPGIFLGDGAVLTTVVQDPFLYTPAAPSINSNMQTAYRSREDLGDGDGEQDALAIGAGGVRTVRFNAGDQSNFSPKPIHAISRNPAPTIDDAGNVVFAGRRYEEPTNPNNQDAPDGLFLSTGGTSVENIVWEGDVFDGKTIVDVNPQVPFDRNNAGDTVARVQTATEEHILLHSGAGLTSLVSRRFSDFSTPGAFRDFRALALSESGDLAFTARFNDPSVGSREGLFYLSNGDTDPTRVLFPGDELFGSTVTSVEMDRYGLNDSEEIAFQANLADGRTVVALASFTQYVGLAWGVNVPRAFNVVTDATGRVSTVVVDGTTAAATVNQATRDDIRDRMIEILDESAVTNVKIVDGLVSNGSNIFFADRLTGSDLLGRAYTGVDQFNSSHEGEAAVFLTGMNELDAEDAMHELGHLLGLRHVNPAAVYDPDNLSLMDYDDDLGDVEEFIDAVSEIIEPPDKPVSTHGIDVTHNPIYHLYRYIDRLSDEELESLDVMPGDWDLMPSEGGSASRVAVGLDFGGTEHELFEVQILAGIGEGLEQLANFDAITLEELAQLSWTLDLGMTLEILASSSPGGALDVMLASGDPFDDANVGVLSLPGEHATNLQLVTDGAGGYVTLANATLFGTAVPEPATYLLCLLGAVGLMSWRRTAA